MEQTTFEVRGIHCGACEKRIQETLSRLDGVKRSEADHKSGEVRVALDPARTPADAVRACLEQAGFEVTGTRAGGAA